MDEADHHPLVEDRDGEGDDGDDQQQAERCAADDAAEDRDHQEEPEGGRDQHAEVLFVEVEDPVEDLADAERSSAVHGAQFDSAAYDPCVAEIERKFLSRRCRGPRAPRTAIEQGYLALDEHGEVRLRRIGGELLLTAKSGHGEVREEVEVSIDPSAFEALWPLTAGRRVRKVRHYVPLGDGAAGGDRRLRRGARRAADGRDRVRLARGSRPLSRRRPGSGTS